ncbi:DsbA family protein [Streptomyces sp. NPDC048191]|uniref:2-hydroxychromene-2-carboxylate isomerase n=1 Tax=Streptomyces sp. NPDC048191 TaxID=3155484 RepID=UPI0033CC7306
MPTAAPRFYFSLRSPYSWLAQYDLLNTYPDVAEEVEWRPFWEPDDRSAKELADAGGEFLYTPMSRTKHLYILQDVRRLATRRNLTVTWPLDRDPCWEISHLPYFHAARAGLGRAYVAAVSRARWQDGQDISRRETIGDIASALGLDRGEAETAYDDPDVRREATEALVALHRDGVFGVPFFVVGREKFWGIDRLPDFVAAVRGTRAASEAAAAQAPEVPGRPATFDDGHAGGCG